MESVAVSSIVFMCISLLLSIALPVGMLLYFLLRKKADILPFFIGCAVMVLFAFILEAAVHRLVLGSGAGETIRNNVWLYALYGGAMAGLFEEAGRYIAFRTVLRRRQNKDVNALMYGAGHGGIEALAILGITMINNIIYSVLINIGNISLITASVPAEYKAQVEEAVTTLISTPGYQFLMGGVERILACILQICLSVIVWFAAKKTGKKHLLFIAILLHFIVDAVTVLAADRLPVIGVEIILAVMTCVIVLYARRVWKENASDNTMPANEKTAVS